MTNVVTSNTTLRPGLLIGLKTSIKGNVSYVKTEVEGEHIEETGAAKASWETERTIENPKEHEAATKVRSKARSLLTAVCASTAFGLLCTEEKEPELEKAVIAARKLCDDFNATAELSRVSFNVITGRVSPTDGEAIRAINGEIRDLITDMEEGIKNLDVAVVREAATKAKQIGSMLNDNAKAKVQEAIDAARKTATKIVKAGEAAATEIDQQALTTLRNARTAFLDLDPVAAEVAAPHVEGRAIDLAPVSDVNTPDAKLSADEIERLDNDARDVADSRSAQEAEGELKLSDAEVENVGAA